MKAETKKSFLSLGNKALDILGKLALAGMTGLGAYYGIPIAFH